MPLELIEGQVVRTDVVEYLYPETIQSRISERNDAIKRLQDENTIDRDLLTEVNNLLNK